MGVLTGTVRRIWVQVDDSRTYVRAQAAPRKFAEGSQAEQGLRLRGVLNGGRSAYIARDISAGADGFDATAFCSCFTSCAPDSAACCNAAQRVAARRSVRRAELVALWCTVVQRGGGALRQQPWAAADGAAHSQQRLHLQPQLPILLARRRHLRAAATGHVATRRITARRSQAIHPPRARRCGRWRARLVRSGAADGTAARCAISGMPGHGCMLHAATGRAAACTLRNGRLPAMHAARCPPAARAPRSSPCLQQR